MVVQYTSCGRGGGEGPIKGVMGRRDQATNPPPAPGAAARTLGGRTPVARAPVAAAPDARVVSGGWQIEGLPDIVRSAGPQAAERTVECVTAQIRNPYTRAAYAAAVRPKAALVLEQCALRRRPESDTLDVGVGWGRPASPSHIDLLPVHRGGDRKLARVLEAVRTLAGLGVLGCSHGWRLAGAVRAPKHLVRRVEHLPPALL